MAKVSSPDPTETPVPTAPAATPEPVLPTPTTVPEPEPTGFDATDMAGLMEEVMSSPELMGCLSSSLGLAGLMGLAEGEPTSDEIEQILPCFSEDRTGSMIGGLTGLIGSEDPVATANPAATADDTEAPAVTTQTALVRPDGVPWYDGPLFDSHMHITGVTMPFLGGSYSTSDVLRMMDRHNI